MNTSQVTQQGQDTGRPEDSDLSFKVDMDDVTRQAIESRRRWNVEFDCDGLPFRWIGKAANEDEAVDKAKAHLFREYHAFNPDRARRAVVYTYIE